ncbi:hypothetical protein Trco_004998 [Trichoderma cornu-damae]|uniref:HNH nuclease domain-containing protein n=1 Tax=Trichoderma cornu-damae TaxID=654480 RepID=A0A9P8QI78_9HYPO|nr:hypothetical protein Trco_004998 [Trichoderma cornu-damae]
MSTASVTPPMRAHGWNVHFLATSSGSHFAGLFGLDGFNLTYHDVLAEMRLCFDIPEDRFQGQGWTNAQDSDADPWDDLAFGFAGFVNLPPSEASAHPAPSPAVVTCTNLNRLVTLPPAAPSTSPGERPIVRFHLVRHHSCNLPSTAPLASHLKDGCARHIPRPIRRRDARYLPPEKPLNNTLITPLPLRRRALARRSSQSPSRRSASGSTSPDKSPESSQLPSDEDEGFSNMMAPPDMDIAADVGRQTIAGFRSSCLVAAQQCAVSGKGRSWCVSPSVGPALQACHIIPQQHYHLYPDPESPNDVGLSPRRLQEAWQRTWSAENGILLMSHLHELFDSRLFSIHPETLQIRAFVPYDAIYDYHGVTARVPSNVDRNALRHHYDMFCIENMAAKMPWIDQPSEFEIESATSCTTSPFQTRTNFPGISTPRDTLEQSHPGDDARSTQHTRGDPFKRLRPATDGLKSERSALDESDDSVCEHKQKRRRISGHTCEEHPRDNDGNTGPGPTYDSYITPPTSQLFLADVNWELRKLTPT